MSYFGKHGPRHRNINMLSVVEGEEYIGDKDCKSSPQHITSLKKKVKKRTSEEDQNYIGSGGSHHVGYREIHSKSKNVSRNHHQRHQDQSYSIFSKEEIQQENLLHPTRDKLVMDQNENKKKDYKRRSRKKKLTPSSERNVADAQDSEEEEQNASEDENSYALNNVCNNSNGGIGEISRWNELRKSICPEEAIIAPSAAFIEHDIISKQRKEILLLMDELGTRDQELNDLVRSHQAQVKAWEADRNKLKDLQGRLFNYEKELHQSDNHLQATLNEMKQVTDQKEMDGMELKKTKGEMEKLSHKIKENSFYLKEMEIQNRNLLDSVKKLVHDKDDLENRGKDLSSRLKSKAGELNLQASEITRLTAQNITLESKLSDAHESIKNLKAESSVWKKRYCSAKDEADRLTNDNATKDGHMQNLTTQLHETLQQTLALQKALFTSCEREKCKEEIMNSLRKQQKRTMHEMASLRKYDFKEQIESDTIMTYKDTIVSSSNIPTDLLYERQTKDMTLYHLSIQNSGTEGGSSELVKTERVRDQGGQGEGKGGVRRCQDQQQDEKPGGSKGGGGKQNDGRNDKNMSYHEHKHKYMTRDDMLSLSVKKNDASNGQEDYDERNDFIRSMNSDIEGSEPGNFKEHRHNVVRRENNAEVESVSTPMNKKGRGKGDGDTLDSSTTRSRNLSRQRSEMETLNRRSKSLSSEKKDSLRHIILQRQYSCSRGTSPINLQDKGSSPITNLYTAHENTTSLNSDFKTLSEDKRSSKTMCKSMDTSDNKTEETSGVIGKYKSTPEKESSMIVWPKSKKTHTTHNETSGVYLSSSDCSSSTLSSPGREKVFDELTPADSDGMCNELQRKYLPNQRQPTRSYLGGYDQKAASIHLRNSPAVIPDPKMDTSTGFSNHRDGDDNCAVKRNVFVAGTYRLVDDTQNEDSMIKKEKWSESSDMQNSSGGLCTLTRTDEIKDLTGRRVFQPFDKRMNLSNVHNDTFSINKGAGDMDSLSVSDSIDNETRTSCVNNNRYLIMNASLDNKEPNCAKGTPLSNKNLTDAELRYLQPSSQFSNGEGRRYFSLERSDREKETSGLGTQIGCAERRRLASSGRCVRIISPQQDISNTKALNDLWRKDAMNRINIQNDSMPSDSDLSDMSLVSISTKSNVSSLKEKLDRITARSSAAKSVDTSKTRQRSPQQRGEGDSKNIESNKEGNKISSVDTNRNYFYEENFSSDSENSHLRKSNTACENKMERDAYIVPVSSSTCSRPFMSSKAPSLYKRLSSIHFSEKSRRYEWDTLGSSQGSEGEENQGLSHREGKPGILSFPIKEHIDDEDVHKGSYSYNNSNNSNSEPLEIGDEMIDVFLEESDPDSAIFYSHNPNTNMDKFHHHYNNIVKKLSFSNIIVNVDDTSETEESVITHQDFIPPIPVAPEKLMKVNKRSECCKTQSDESIFSPSQICVTVCNSENDSVVDNDIVRKLDFSDSTCVDQSNLEIETVYTSHFSNIFGVNSEDKSVVNHEVKELEKMNIPVECPEINSRFYPHSIWKYVHDRNNGIDHFNDTSEVNVDFKDIFQQPKNEYVFNIDDSDNGTVYDKDKTLPAINGRCESSENLLNPKTPIHTIQQEGKGEAELVASLPDYFPDISSVIGDEDSVSVNDAVGGKTRGEFNDSILITQFDEDSLLDNDGNVTPKSMAKQPYSHTSTPTTTKSKTFSTASNNRLSTNDLNSPYNDKRKYDKVEEKTLTSKETLELECLSVDGDVNTECVSEVDDGGDGLQHQDKLAQKSTSEKETHRQIVDSNSIVIDIIKEKCDMKKNIYSGHDDAGYQSLGRSSERLEKDQELLHQKHCSSEDKTEKYCVISCLSKELGVITAQSSKLVPLEVKCGGDASRTEGNDSSYLEGPWDRFEDRLSNFLSDTPRHETSEDLSLASTVPMSPASKLHRLLVESQEMIRSLEKRVPVQK